MYVDFENTVTYAKYWSDKTKMSYLERHILVHSYMYYNLNVSLITDKTYDELCKQLMDIIKNNPEEFKHSEYYYCFKNFDGTTGFDLFDNLEYIDKEYIIKLANNILNLWKAGI